LPVDWGKKGSRRWSNRWHVWSKTQTSYEIQSSTLTKSIYICSNMWNMYKWEEKGIKHVVVAKVEYKRKLILYVFSFIASKILPFQMIFINKIEVNLPPCNED